MNVVAVVSDKRLDLFVQTVYTNVKKGNLATPIGEQAPINTPKANSSTVSTHNVAQQEQNVKPKSSRELETVEELRQQNELLKKQVDYWHSTGRRRAKKERPGGREVFA